MAQLRTWVAASFGLLVTSQECPDYPNPYSDEKNPFGFPLTPAAWDFQNQACWAKHYPMCGGDHQSPMELDLSLPASECLQEAEGQPGSLVTSYKAVASESLSTVSVSNYMRSVAVSGSFGSITLKDAHGHDVEYVAEQLHLMNDHLHRIRTSDGTLEEAVAELLVVHRPSTPSASLPSFVMVSMLFRQDATASSIFSALGLDSAPQASVWNAQNIYLNDVLSDALSGSSFSYDGSIPVPPCTESVHYIVLERQQSVSASQLQNLRTVLNQHAGGYMKRDNVPRKAANKECRRVLVNRAELPEIAPPAGEHCDKSPIDVVPAAGPPGAGEAPAMHYKPASNVQVKPSKYAVEAHGDFGSLLVNGRLFLAKKVSFQAVSRHTYSGKRYAGELVIEHHLFGDDFGQARRLDAHEGGEAHEGADEHAPASEGADEHAGEVHSNATASHGNVTAPHHEEPHGEAEPESHEDEGHGDEHEHHSEHHGPTEAYVADGPHRVLVVVPLALGGESELFRDFGLGLEAHKRAIRNGDGFDLGSPVDLNEHLAATVSKDWFWYSGGPTEPGACPAWGVKYLLFEEPLEVSVAQLNFLSTEVSPFDALPPLVAHEPLLARTIPEGGVEPEGTCEEAATKYRYLKPSCWKHDTPSCSGGQAQSPVNIQTASIAAVGEVSSFLPRLSWKPVDHLRLTNDDRALGFASQQLGYARVTGPNGFPKFYQAVEVTLRMPSEHMVDGHQFAAELQVTHKNQNTVLDLDDGDLLITSVFFELGAPSKLLDQLLPPTLPASHEHSSIDMPVDLMWALGPAMDGSFYAYNGSCTSTCAEVAQWVLFEKAMTLSEDQLRHFKAAFPNPGNNRPVQPLNGRSVYKNTLLEVDEVQYTMFLNREMGHDRSANTPPHMIMFPIIGTLLLCSAVMFGTFVREDKRFMAGAGGLREAPMATTEETATMIGRRG